MNFIESINQDLQSLAQWATGLSLVVLISDPKTMPDLAKKAEQLTEIADKLNTITEAFALSARLLTKAMQENEAESEEALSSR